MYQDDINKKVDLGTKNKQDGDSIRVSFSKINSMATELYANDAELDGRVTTNTNDIANHEIRLGDLEGMTLTADQAAQEIYIRNAQGILIDKLSVAFLNNEGTTFVYNEINETLDLKNDAGTILASVPVSAFVSNLAKSISLNYNVLTLKDTEGNALSSVELNIENIAGLQTALDDAGNKDNNIVKMLQIPTDKVTTQDEAGIVEYINNLPDTDKITITKDEIMVVEFIEPPVFSTTWDTTIAGASTSTQVQLPVPTTGTLTEAVTVDWGDGNVETFTDYASLSTAHTYATGGVYTIKMSGRVENFVFSYGGDCDKILSVNSWGNFIFSDDGSVFGGCDNVTMDNITDIPDLSSTTNLDWAFDGCRVLRDIGRINEWDTSTITSLLGTFYYSKFNGSVGNWNVSNVTNMTLTFYDCEMNDPTIDNWDVSNVTTFDQCFSFNRVFNQSLNNWNINTVSPVNMNSMFQDAEVFNGDITAWNTANVTNMRWMFKGTPFNQPIGNWNVSSVTDMDNMFYLSQFNQSLSLWDTSSVVDMSGMFRSCPFNQDISMWSFISIAPRESYGNYYDGMDRMFDDNTAFTTANYDALLVSLSGQTINPNVKLGASTTQYSSSSQSARDILTNDPNYWVITDAGVVA